LTHGNELHDDCCIIKEIFDLRNSNCIEEELHAEEVNWIALMNKS